MNCVYKKGRLGNYRDINLSFIYYICIYLFDVYLTKVSITEAI
jgi:hypothetical protein